MLQTAHIFGPDASPITPRFLASLRACAAMMLILLLFSAPSPARATTEYELFSYARDIGMDRYSSGEAAYKAIENEDYETAVRLYTHGAGLGSATAMNNLGTLYARGLGVKKSQRAALRLYRQAARKDLAEGQYNLAVMYQHGRTTNRNPVLAARWYRDAAAQGHGPSMINLGTMLFEGKQIRRDYKLALKLFQAAADIGYPEAIYNIGVAHWFGRGVEENRKRAVELFGQAANMGHGPALVTLQQLVRHPDTPDPVSHKSG